MIGMPRRVKVGAHVYKILVKPASVMWDKGEALHGWCRFHSLEIWIVRGLPLSKRQEILLHEVLHAATHPTLNCCKRINDEEFVTAISPVLKEVLQDNLPLVMFLTQK